MESAYRILCGALGVSFVLFGLACFAAFFQFQAPGGEGLGGPLAVGPNGVYFVAFTGCCLVGWGGCLLGAARDPIAAPWIATATAFALVLNALYRMVAWLIGDYHELANLPRIEAGAFLAVAVALLWLRPTPKLAQEA